MVIAELTLAAQPDEVWRHLREPALISRWFGWDYEGLGHEIDVIFLQEARVDDRGHVLEWGDGLEDGDRFELEDLGVETRLRVIRAAPVDGYEFRLQTSSRPRFPCGAVIPPEVPRTSMTTPPYRPCPHKGRLQDGSRKRWAADWFEVLGSAPLGSCWNS